jgi:ABC-2 type transport system ATP-binding protein
VNEDTGNRALAAGSLLAAEGITVHYGRRTALSAVTLAVPAGAVYALLGRNGAGKTSLVRCLLGELRPAAGRAWLLGRDSWRERAVALREVGVVPEEPNAPRAATARQLSTFCSRLHRRWDAGAFAARLERFGVPLAVPFAQLSKGQRGQVSLALALASSPRLLILDDPTLGLDALARRSVFEELIGELADRGTTVFVATHELAAIEGIADRVAILDAGRLVVDEELEGLKQRFRRIRLPAPLAPEPAAARRAADAAAAAPLAPEPALAVIAGVAGVAGATETAGAGSGPAREALLAELTPVRRVARGWGTDLVVARYDEERFERFRRGPGGHGADVAALTLEEIFVTLVGGKEVA